MTSWTASDIPDLTGRRAVVTGATSGLGLRTALELARHGASVLMTARDAERGDRAVQQVRGELPAADVRRADLDLADLASVRAFADEHGQQPLDLLVNNAGVMALPPRVTADGFEMQLGTNHLGPFALTGLLLPALLGAPGARVVAVSSLAHRMGRLDLDDLMGERQYQPWTAYAQSKLANLLFMTELDRRSRAAGADLVSAAAHPGYTATNLQAAGPRMSGRRLQTYATSLLTAVVGQRAATGALPQLYAATAPGVRGGDYVGPRGPLEARGRPRPVRMSAAAQDEQAARGLWERSEELTGVTYDWATVPV
jgi:NAD(P)-dependent dehydrogenase (short-subunit alcohol dehydrogenase family)